MDIGTNTELLLGHRGRILAASCPAGPAFEGGAISCGMPALDGAIATVEARDDGSFALGVIGDGPAGGAVRVGARRSVERAAAHRPDERDGPLRGRRARRSSSTPGDGRRPARERRQRAGPGQGRQRRRAAGRPRHVRRRLRRHRRLLPRRRVRPAPAPRVGAAHRPGAGDRSGRRSSRSATPRSKARRSPCCRGRSAPSSKRPSARRALPARNAPGFFDFFVDGCQFAPVIAVLQVARSMLRASSEQAPRTLESRGSEATMIAWPTCGRRCRSTRRIRAAARLPARHRLDGRAARAGRRGARPGTPSTAGRGSSPARRRRWPWTPTACASTAAASPARACASRWSTPAPHSGVLVAVGAGPELEAEAPRRWLDEKPDEYFFLEVYGSAVVEHLVTQAGARLCGWAEAQGLAVLPHDSPGYPDWDIAEQAALHGLLTASETPLPSALEVLESGALRPKKSLIAVFGLTRHVDRLVHLRDLVPCERCSFTPCQYRRAPYRRGAPRSTARTFDEPGRDDVADEPRAGSGGGLHGEAQALRRWAAERLTLTPRARRIDRRALPLRGHDLLEHGPPAALRLPRPARPAARRLSDSRATLRAGRRRHRPHEDVPLPGDRRHAHRPDRGRRRRSPASR